ncbi:molecular chaperone [Yokenella regensburgei]|uniref:fimbrial biogenesis chaperone n=1 Tax=Yokenella regensburgei TaxID=158877 RepID=UPI0013763792|nr:fimbria/pilus periplasmic chaperone [Yokenella regensburgei]KAF1366707.1 chaperone protein EcpD [Yokenella regensburgei]
MKIVVLFFLFFISSFLSAKSIISGTRVIFHGYKKEATVNVENTGNEPVLIQSWIDDGDAKAEPSKIKVPFIIPNGMVTVSPNDTFTIRIFKKQEIERYPMDRESLFYLNVVDIPPKPTKINENSNAIIQFVVRSRIKLIYRPDGLNGNANLALGDLIFRSYGNEIEIDNPTPFFININDVVDVNKKIKLFDSYIVPPFSNANRIKMNNISKSISITALNDLGAKVERVIHF